jgi:hypothetical protein
MNEKKGWPYLFTWVWRKEEKKEGADDTDEPSAQSLQRCNWPYGGDGDDDDDGI